MLPGDLYYRFQFIPTLPATTITMNTVFIKKNSVTRVCTPESRLWTLDFRLKTRRSFLNIQYLNSTMVPEEEPAIF